MRHAFACGAKSDEKLASMCHEMVSHTSRCWPGGDADEASSRAADHAAMSGRLSCSSNSNETRRSNIISAWWWRRSGVCEGHDKTNDRRRRRTAATAPRALRRCPLSSPANDSRDMIAAILSYSLSTSQASRPTLAIRHPSSRSQPAAYTSLSFDRQVTE